MYFNKQLKIKLTLLGAHIYNLNTQEADAVGLFCVQGSTGLHNEF